MHPLLQTNNFLAVATHTYKLGSTPVMRTQPNGCQTQLFGNSFVDAVYCGVQSF